jgi:hypothetical protein
MATRVSLANVARIAVGVVAIVWALLGIGDALAAGMGRAMDAAAVAAVIVNGLLVVTALLTFVRFRFWYPLLIVCTVFVTIDRLLGVAAAGDWWLGLSSVAMLLAVVGISMVARDT